MRPQTWSIAGLLVTLGVAATPVVAQQLVDRGAPAQAAPARRHAPVLGSTAFTMTQANGAAGLASMFCTSSSAHVGGAAWIDYNNDYWPDLFITNGSGYPHIFYRNDGDGTFTDLSYLLPKPDIFLECAGALFADVENDGDSDLLVVVDSPLLTGIPPVDGGPNLLYLNNGDGTFTEAGGARGVVDPAGRRNMCGGFADYDRDGFVDLYLSNWQPGNTDGEINYDRLLCNDGFGSFTNVAAPLRLNGYGRDALTSLWFDADGDRWMDLYVGNVGEEYGGALEPDNNDILYVYLPDKGYFCDATGDPHLIGNDAKASMGADVGDIDNDGDWDLYVTDNISSGPAPFGNVLYVNNGDGTFQDNSCNLSGVCAINSWPCKFEDFDLDGWVDLWVGSSRAFDVDAIYRNVGDGTFAVQVIELGGTTARGGTTADYDGDGDVDIVIVNHNRNSVLVRNDTATSGNWLEIRLFGTASNRDAIGAHVTVTAGGTSQLRRVSGGDSAHSQSEQIVHFGLGAATAADVTIEWPNGGTTFVPNVAANDLIFVDESLGRLPEQLSDVTAHYDPAAMTLEVSVKSSFGGRTGFQAVGYGSLEYDVETITFGKTFGSVRAYQSLLALDSSRGQRFLVPVTFGAAPTADFVALATEGSAPLSVPFLSLSSSDVTAWSWDFGDGDGSTAENPVHLYDTPGTYTVSLTVTAPGGVDSETKVDYVTVNP